MKEKKLLLGDEAIALGAIHAGLSGVYAYPGTPSTEITEFIQNDRYAKEHNVRSRWCTNEKTAMEAALGMSYGGKRSIVCMKHVGMNVCADPFMNSAMSGVKGGLVVVAADDPSMHSSQNEQDSRFYGKFAMIPVFEPSNQQEAYDMMATAFALSEEMRLPVMMRLVTRLSHSRAAVEVGEPIPQNEFAPDKDTSRWVVLPVNARRLYLSLIDKQKVLETASEESRFNGMRNVEADSRQGIIACGLGYNYVSEAGGTNVLKISQYPLPVSQILALAERCDDILVVEEGMPVVEEMIKGILGAGYSVSGRLSGRLPRTGELTPDCVAAALGRRCEVAFPPAKNLASRPPQLCQGCGHRDVFSAINKVAADYPGARVFGDIGCYTLGALPPFNTIDTCIDMGASITMAKGAADAGVFPAIAVIGDSTFTHSGMTGLLDAVNDNANITVFISDNLTTAMTGGQDSAGTNKFEQICLALGVHPDHVKVVVPVPKNMEEITRIIREEFEYNGVSVIIPRRECMQTLNRKLRKARAAKSQEK